MPPAVADNRPMNLASTKDYRQAHADILLALDNASRATTRPNNVSLLAVSKTRTPTEIAELAAAGQRVFGENYVQEALPKIAALRPLGLEWHLIGHLQSNKAQEAARAFDWVQTIDRAAVAPSGRSAAKVCGLLLLVFFAHEAVFVAAVGIVIMLAVAYPLQRRPTLLRLLPVLAAALFMAGQWVYQARLFTKG